MEKAIPTVSESVATSGEVSLPILIPTAIIFVLTVFGLWAVLLAIGYYEMLKTPDKEVVCVIMIELYQGVAKTIWVVVTVILVNMVVVIYGLFWLRIRYSMGADDTIKKAMKSITVVVAILVCGWVISSASRVTCLLLNVDDKTLTYVLLYSAIATNIGCSANYYVYYWISSDYRSALKKQLDFVLCRGWKIVRISDTNNPGLANGSTVRSSRVSKSALSVAQQHNGSLQMPPPNIPE
uniref:G-protein coupled receptors family 1 profile domain-containing protein n=1 Tax=Acrobeloides nanus TaxID=290746 RepID=A0A914BZG2_9BILA